MSITSSLHSLSRSLTQSAPPSISGKSDDSASTRNTEKFVARAERALKHDASSSHHHQSTASIPRPKIVRRKISRSLEEEENQQRMLSLGGALNEVPFVGREEEMASIGQSIDLLMTKNDVCGENNNLEESKLPPRVISLVGDAGSGKSRLAQALRSGVIERDGYFVRGKCDLNQQQQQTAPAASATGGGGEAQAYAGLSIAMQDLADQILARDFDMGIRRRLQEAVGPENACVLLEIFPSLSALLSTDDDEFDYLKEEKKDPEPSTPQASQRAKRRRFLFRQFIRVLLTHSSDYEDEDVDAVTDGGEQAPQQEQPFCLVMVLEDVQWIDLPSLELLSVLARDPVLQSFMLVVTRRPSKDEANDVFLKEAELWDVTTQCYHLENLDVFSINTILASVLDTERELTNDLAETIHQKTAGNAFFAIEFVKALVDQNMLTFSYGDMRWKWDTRKVQSLVIRGDNAVGLLTAKLKRLPRNKQLILVIAACLGSSFEEEFLQRVVQKVDSEELLPSWQSGLGAPQPPEPIGIAVSSLLQMGLLKRHKEFLFFAHDLIKEATWEFISSDNICTLQARVGECILGSILSEQDTHQHNSGDALLFLGVDLCNSSMKCLRKEHASMLAQYNLLAGERAMRDSAFPTALRYMRTGLSFFEIEHKTPRESKTEIYEKLLAGAAEASYCSGSFEDTSSFADKLLRRGCPQELVLRMLYLKILSSMAELKADDAMKYGWSAIEILQIASIPKQPNMFHVMRELLKTKRVLRNHNVETLVALPVLADERRIQAQRLFDTIQGAAYLSQPTFFLVSQLKAIRWAVKYGVSKYTPSAFGLYGVILQSVMFNDVQGGRMCGEVALALAERLGDKEALAKASMSVFNLIHHWTNDMRSCFPPTAYASKLALECGDSETALTAFWYMDVCSWCCARVPLQVLARDMERHAAAASLEYKHPSIGGSLAFLGEGLRRLCGDGKEFLWLDSPRFTRDEIDGKAEGKVLPAVKAFRNVISLQSHLLLGELDEALNTARELHDVVKSCMGLAFVYRAQFYKGLVFLTLAGNGTDTRKNLRMAGSLLSYLKKWSDNGNVNCMHMAALLEAETARVKNQVEIASKHYRDAIQMATMSAHIHDAAISNQCAALFYLQIDDKQRASHHVQQSIKFFRQWGANAMVRLLREEHSELLGVPTFGLSING